MLEEHREEAPTTGTQACPKCGHTELEIEVEVVTKVWVEFGPYNTYEITDVKEGDLDWEDDDAARCSRCNWTGKVGELTER